MRKIATIPARDREALFRNTAAKMGILYFCLFCGATKNDKDVIIHRSVKSN